MSAVSEQLHRAQVLILSNLRHTPAARFSTLMQPTGMQSDVFKFHMRKLVRLGYIEKSEHGQYRLTSQGKEFANNLDETKRATQRQPKLSILLIVRHPDNPEQFLFQKRLRNPFYGYWSCIVGPVQWGDEFETTAANELRKQTGLIATCSVHSFYRERDYAAATNHLLEDKLFVIMEATDVTGELSNQWYAGHNDWMTLQAFQSQPKFFPSVCKAVEILETDQCYFSKRVHYTSGQY